jgi:hypothetical protein
MEGARREESEKEQRAERASNVSKRHLLPAYLPASGAGSARGGREWECGVLEARARAPSRGVRVSAMLSRRLETSGPLTSLIALTSVAGPRA